MLDLPSLLAFLAAAALLTVTPGVDNAMVLRSAAVDGARAAWAAATGIALGCLIWGAAVSLGLGVLLLASELAYAAVKWVGAAYLVWLGVLLLWRPRSAFVTEGRTARASSLVALRRGFLTNILNPKIGLFYVTFLPQFIPGGANVAVHSFLLTGLHVLIGFAWFALLIGATVPLRRVLQRPAVIRTLDRLTGGVFLAFGLRLAAGR